MKGFATRALLILPTDASFRYYNCTPETFVSSIEILSDVVREMGVRLDVLERNRMEDLTFKGLTYINDFPQQDEGLLKQFTDSYPTDTIYPDILCIPNFDKEKYVIKRGMSTDDILNTLDERWKEMSKSLFKEYPITISFGNKSYQHNKKSALGKMSISLDKDLSIVKTMLGEEPISPENIFLNIVNPMDKIYNYIRKEK